MKICKLEDLKVWQESKSLMLLVYKFTEQYPLSEKYNLVRHMRECARNIPANIAEGYGRFHFQESMQFNRIARGSLMELKSDIICSKDLKYLSDREASILLDKLELANRLLNGFIKSTIKVKQ